MIFEKKALVISSDWNVFPFFFTKGNKQQFNPDQLPSGIYVVSSTGTRVQSLDPDDSAANQSLN